MRMRTRVLIEVGSNWKISAEMLSHRYNYDDFFLSYSFGWSWVLLLFLFVR